MDTATRAMLVCSLLLLAMTLAGLAVQQRMRRAVLFPVYLAAVALSEAARLTRPVLFSDWNLWVTRELIVGVLSACVAIEIATRAFARLPGAAARFRGVRGAIFLATLAALILMPGLLDSGASWRFVLVTQVLPRLAFGTALLCIATLMTMAFHIVPVDPLHRSILLGLASYLVLYAGTLGSASTHAWSRIVTYRVLPIVYLVTLALWAYAAWRREREPRVSRAVVERLHPWR